MTEFPPNDPSDPRQGAIDPPHQAMSAMYSSEPPAMDRDPAPQHQPDFWSRLDGALESEPAPVRPLPMMQDMKAESRAWQSPMLVAAALLMVGLVGAIVVLTNRGEEPSSVFTEPPEPTAVVVAPTALSVITPEPSLQGPDQVVVPLPIPTPEVPVFFTRQEVLGGEPGLWLQDTPDGSYYLSFSDNNEDPCPTDVQSEKFRVFFVPLGTTVAQPTNVETFHLMPDIYRAISSDRYVSYEMTPGDCRGSRLVIGELLDGVPVGVVNTVNLNDSGRASITALSGLEPNYPLVTLTVTDPETDVAKVVQVDVETLEQTILREPGVTPVADPDQISGTGVTMCQAGDTAQQISGGIGFRFEDLGERLTAQYAFAGDDDFDGAVQWTAGVVRDTDPDISVEQLAARYLTDPDTALFDGLVQGLPAALAARPMLAESLNCFVHPEADRVEQSLMPQRTFDAGPWKCFIDPNLGVNPLGMRAFLTLQTTADGQVQWLYEKFGNAVGDGSGYQTVNVDPNDPSVMPGHAVTSILAASAELGFDAEVIMALQSVMSCERNPEFQTDGGWYDPTGVFPFELETEASKALTFDVGNEGYVNFETQSFDWLAYPDVGDQRCDGGLSYSIDVTDRETGATATALQNIPADQIVSVTVREPDAGVLILSKCGTTYTLRMGWLDNVGPMGHGPDSDAAPAVIEMPLVTEATSATMDSSGNIVITSSIGESAILAGSYIDTTGTERNNIPLPLAPRPPTSSYTSDDFRNRQIYALATTVLEPATCKSPEAPDTGALFYLVSATVEAPTEVEFLALAGQARPRPEYSSLSADGSLLAMPSAFCSESQAMAVDVYNVFESGAILRSHSFGGDTFEPLFGGAAEILGTRFIDADTVEVNGTRLADGVFVSATVDVPAN